MARPLSRAAGIVRDYDAAADGQRFLIAAAEPDPVPLTVLASWPSLLPSLK